MRRLYTYIVAIILVSTSCQHQPILEREFEYTSAEIPVKINWATSGIEVDEYGMALTKGDTKLIHRTTFRFFPKDGSEPFERYIGAGESIWTGYITIPIGEYSIIVMNDAITDNFWNGSESMGSQSVGFDNTNNYEQFAAFVNTSSNYPDEYRWNAYKGSHQFMQQPLRLSSYSIDDFKVTEGMAEYYISIKNKENNISNKEIDFSSLTEEEQAMYLKLTRDFEGDTDGLDMRKLSKDVRVVLNVKNLTSAEYINGGLTGFVNKVNMRSGIGYMEPEEMQTLTYFKFNGRKNWFDAEGNPANTPSAGENIYEDYVGETSIDFLSFGRELQLEENERYDLDLDILYINGKLMDKNQEFTLDIDRDGIIDAPTKLPFNVTTQVKSKNTPEGIDIYIYLGRLDLEYTTGDIKVNSWGDDNIVDL